MKTVFLILFLSLFIPGLVVAQDIAKESAVPVSTPSTPKVGFVFDHDKLDVAHYEFELQQDCRATYESRSKPDPQTQEVETLKKEIKLSPATCARIFELAKSANYFNGNFDF